jgi:hypothetical protein
MGGAIGGSIAAGGALIGNDAASGERRLARQGVDERGQLISNLSVPQLQQLVLENPQYLGDLTPQQQQAIGLGPTAMQDISTDPRLKAAQYAALQQMTGVSQTGLAPQDIAALEQIRRQTSAQDQAKQAQLMQEMQARGQGGSGAELAQRLLSSQSAADRASSQDLDIARQAGAQRLAAIGQEAGMAGNIRGQEYGEQANLAQAKDIINKFNVQNQQQVQAANVATQNQAAARNVGERQRIGEAGTGVRNLATQYNTTQLPLAQYNANMQKLGLQLGQKDLESQMHGTEAGRIAGMWAGIGKGIGAGVSSDLSMGGGSSGGSGGGGGGGLVGSVMGMFSDERNKKNIQPADIDIQEFLNKISPKTYEYKHPEEPGTAPGQRYGVVAQDLEKSDAGKSIVHDTSNGKILDTTQGFGLVLAALANLNERMKKFEG